MVDIGTNNMFFVGLSTNSLYGSLLIEYHISHIEFVYLENGPKLPEINTFRHLDIDLMV